MLFGVYGFVSGEKTAITTVPAQIATVPVYVPQTPTPVPPTATPLPTATAGPTAETGAGGASPVTWIDVGSLLAARCGTCHSATLATAGLSLATYADAMKGGQDGAVIVPGSADSSLSDSGAVKGRAPRAVDGRGTGACAGLDRGGCHREMRLETGHRIPSGPSPGSQRGGGV